MTHKGPHTQREHRPSGTRPVFLRLTLLVLAAAGLAASISDATIFKLAEGINLSLFALVISDRRRKPGMRPLVPRGVTIAVKMGYPAVLGTFAWSLIRLGQITPGDRIVLALTSGATFLAAWAKRDLGPDHSWAGTYRQGIQRTDRGLYAAIEHPMYVAILTWLAAGCAFISRYLPRVVWIPTSGLCLLIAAFILVVGRREVQRLPLPPDFNYWPTRLLLAGLLVASAGAAWLPDAISLPELWANFWT